MVHVLLVDGVPAERAALSGFLVARGFSVTAVGTAVEGLRLITDEPPDLVLLGLGLPDLDGVTALRVVRGVCRSPIVVLVPRESEPVVVEAFDAGADDCVVGPFSGEHLAARVRALLRRAGRS